MEEIDSLALEAFFVVDVLFLDEPVFNIDLNYDGDKQDLFVPTNVFLIKKNPKGLNIKRNLFFTNY